MDFKKTLPFLLAIITFIVIALIYFSPVLEGKQILQSDIVQHTGMSKEIQDFRETNHAEPYWTNAAFSGMPAFQVSTLYPNDFIKQIDKVFRFLPRPADYMFLYFIGFFILMLVLKTDWKLAILGALAFGLSTYLIIILGVGHNAKAHAVGYFPLVIAGILLVFQGKYVWGFVLTTLSVALEINTGHVQMTYYLLFILFFIGLFEFINKLKEKKIFDFAKQIAVLLFAALLAIGMNMNHLLPTKEYSKESTRSKSELTINPDGSPKKASGGLDKDYITEYSYGFAETFNLFIPGFTGGGNSEDFGQDSETYRLLKSKISISDAKDFVKHAPGYWGNQPIVAAPAYIGAVIIFLFVLGIFIVPNKYKYWLLASVILSLLLSWGKNLNFLTDFFIDYFPMYNKFRAVSSIQVIMELAIPIMGVLALQQFLFNDHFDKNQKEKYLKLAFYITGGLALLFTLVGTSLFSFDTPHDAEYDQMLSGLADAFVQDRKNLFFHDSLRTFILVLLSATGLWLWLKNKVKSTPIILLLGILLIFDGFSIAKRYVNNEDFVRASKVKEPFEMSEADKAILQDKSYYRVANFNANPMNDGSTSYFHKSIGGYHAAKPRRYQELFEYQIANGNQEVLNMLNTKYIIGRDQNGQTQVQVNDLAYGNAWFANDIVWVNNANEEIKALDSLNKNKVVFNNVFKKSIPANVANDSIAQIKLTHYAPNKLTYESNANSEQIALFSEMYYPHGWKATINGKNAEIFRANYVLRALVVPAGKNEITFSFEPEVINKGGNISLISFITFIVLTSIAIIYQLKFRKN